jgi:hypothetical protein
VKLAFISRHPKFSSLYRERGGIDGPSLEGVE